MKAFWIDLETTGVDPNLCAIHHAAVIVVVDGVETRHEWKIQPHEGSLYTPGWDVSGVTKEQIEAYPITPAQFHRELLKLLNTHINKYSKTDKFFWLGYNAKFDEAFMRASFLRHKNSFFGAYFWAPVLDVMALAGFALAPERTSLENFKLSTVYEYVFGRPLANAHDGMADIEATRELYEAIYPKFPATLAL